MIDALSGDVQEITWNSLVEVSPTEEQLAGWNLDDAAIPLILYDGDDVVLSLRIGAPDDNGGYYARLDDSSMVYTVTSESVADLLEIEKDSLRVSDLIPLDQSDLKEAVFQTANGSWSIVRTENEVERGAETAVDESVEESTDLMESGETASADESDTANGTGGEPEVSVTVTINGETIDSDSFDSLWSLVRSITVSNYSLVDHLSALLSISVTNEAGIREMFEFYQCDVDSYAVSCSDGHEVQVPADAIDRIIRSLNQLV